MRDPEMCFELRAVEQERRARQYVQLANLHAQHQRFAKVWDNNLRCQGFEEAYDPNKLVRG